MSRTGLMAQDISEYLRKMCGDGSSDWNYEPISTAFLLDIADAIDEGAKLDTLVHDLFSALQALCDANECEYCILACEPYDQCPIDGLRGRVKECE